MFIQDKTENSMLGGNTAQTGKNHSFGGAATWLHPRQQKWMKTQIMYQRGNFNQIFRYIKNKNNCNGNNFAFPYQ